MQLFLSNLLLLFDISCAMVPFKRLLRQLRETRIVSSLKNTLPLYHVPLENWLFGKPGLICSVERQNLKTPKPWKGTCYSFSFTNFLISSIFSRISLALERPKEKGYLSCSFLLRIITGLPWNSVLSTIGASSLCALRLLCASLFYVLL